MVSWVEHENIFITSVPDCNFMRKTDQSNQNQKYCNGIFLPLGFLAHYLIYLSQMNVPIFIGRTSLLQILGVLGDIFHFILKFQ